MAVEFALLILAAYLLGSVPAAYLAAKWLLGIDLRQYGSGNVGVSNLRRLTSNKWVVIPTIIFDAGKGMVMVWAAQLIGLGIAQQVTVGLAAIVGHNWTVFLRFSGGRGVITALGVALLLPSINGLIPWGIVAFLAIVGIGLLIMHETSLGVGAGIAALPLVSWGVGEPLPITLGFLAMLVIVVIRRLMVPPTSATASVPTGQLIVNRLLFDRDIRDREAWINRTSLEVGSAEQPPDQKGKQGKG